MSTSEARSSSHREQDLPVATVTLTLTKQPTEGCTYIEHSTRLLIRESHLEAIQRKHGLSLIKWLETALEIELEALTDGSQG